MNCKKTILILAVLLGLIIATGFCAAAPGPLTGRIIVLDPGHGGTEDGAVANGVREADVNLAVGLKVRDRLIADGAAVIITRSSDRNVLAPDSPLAEELQARVDMTKAADADIFVSLHANSCPNPETAGIIGFYQTGRPDDLARAIQLAAVKETGAVDKGVRPANFHVLRENEVPAALIEMGFLTNPAEAARLADDGYQTRLADGISKGVVAYFQRKRPS